MDWLNSLNQYSQASAKAGTTKSIASTNLNPKAGDRIGGGISSVNGPNFWNSSLQGYQSAMPKPAPISFAQSPQGKAYAQTFSQADAQTKQTLLTHLQAGAKAGNPHSVDQLNAIKKNGGLKNNPVQVAPENIAGVNLPIPLQKIADVATGGAKLAGNFAKQAVVGTATGILGNSSAGETPQAIQDISQHKAVPSSQAGHSESIRDQALGAVTARLGMGGVGEAAAEDAGKTLLSQAAHTGNTFGKFGAGIGAANALTSSQTKIKLLFR